MTVMTADAAARSVDWYRRNFPAHAGWVGDVDPRCFEVLAHLDTLNHLSDRLFDGGGLRRCGDGVAVFYRGEVSTFDGGEMTRLVLAAHHLCCRVSIAPVTVVGLPHGSRDGSEPDWEFVGTVDELAIERELMVGEPWPDATFGHCGRCHLGIRRDHATAEWEHEVPVEEPNAHPLYPLLPAWEVIDTRLCVRVTPRDPSSDHPFGRHPSLDALRLRAEQVSGPS